MKMRQIRLTPYAPLLLPYLFVSRRSTAIASQRTVLRGRVAAVDFYW
jgi:hypothetical protein